MLPDRAFCFNPNSNAPFRYLPLLSTRDTGIVLTAPDWTSISVVQFRCSRVCDMYEHCKGPKTAEEGHQGRMRYQTPSHDSYLLQVRCLIVYHLTNFFATFGTSSIELWTQRLSHGPGLHLPSNCRGSTASNARHFNMRSLPKLLHSKPCRCFQSESLIFSRAERAEREEEPKKECRHPLILTEKDSLPTNQRKTRLFLKFSSPLKLRFTCR